MKSFLKTLTVLAASATLAIAAQAPWTSDYEAAKARAKAENKPIFTYFTGSDWCGWCIKMEKDVLTKKEFLDYAKDHLILLELDYPRKPENKEKQSAELQAQNKKLDEKFKIEGFPTVYLLDAEGEKLAAGEDFALRKYLGEGPAKYVEHLQAALAGKAQP
jgi:protein disulfide-isomerase